MAIKPILNLENNDSDNYNRAVDDVTNEPSNHNTDRNNQAIISKREQSHVADDKMWKDDMELSGATLHTFI